MNKYVVSLLLLGIVGFARGACQCSQKALGNRCYFAIKTGRTQAAQAAACKNSNGYLAEPKSAAQNAFIKSMIQGVGISFIGFGDEKREGVFVDKSRTLLGYTNWVPGEPNNYHNEDCSEMYKTGLWNDILCSYRKPAVCETCKVGFRVYNNVCYQAFTSALTYKQAQTICRFFGGHLATPRTEGENNFIKSLIRGTSFIGFNDLGNEHTWVSDATGCHVAYTKSGTS